MPHVLRNLPGTDDPQRARQDQKGPEGSMNKAREDLARQLQDDLSLMHSRLSGLEDQYRDLQLRYQHAGGHLKSEVHADIEYIQSVRTEAEQILEILQGG